MKLLASCREVREHYTEYTEGTLTWRDRFALRLHLLICTACTEFLKGFLALPGVARALLGPGAPPPEAGQALAGALRRLGGHDHSH